MAGELQALPDLPAGKVWPAHMLRHDRLGQMMRETYARIAHSCAADQALVAEKNAALAWCRANGNPHLKDPSHG